jgi:hypothetical protein
MIMRRFLALSMISLAAVCVLSCASKDSAVAKPAEPPAALTQAAQTVTLRGELALFGNEPFAWLGLRQLQGMDAPLVKLVFTNPSELRQWRDFQNKRVIVQGVLLAPDLSTPQVQVLSIALQP